MEGGGDWEDGNSDCSSASHRSTGSAGSVEADQVEMAEVERLSAQKTSQVLKGDAPQWRQSIRDQMETELERRVREALATPPQEKLNRRRQMEKQKMQRKARHHRHQQQGVLSPAQVKVSCPLSVPKGQVDINAHLLLDLTDREQNSLKTQRWKALQAQKDAIMTYFPSNSSQVEFIFRDELSKSNQDEFPGVFGLESFSEGIKNIREDYTNVINRYGSKPKTRHFYTKEGFLKALRTGNLPSGVQFLDDTGRYVDKYGVIRNSDGPFWPVESVPLFPAPRFKWWTDIRSELLYFHLPGNDYCMLGLWARTLSLKFPGLCVFHGIQRTYLESTIAGYWADHQHSVLNSFLGQSPIILESSRTVDNQVTPYTNRWRGVLIVYDSERSPRDYSPQPVTEGCCPNLVFESRFESGNLRQARRIGMFEYELVLKTDLYTTRHTQWYFFRVHNAQPNVTYKFRIVNLLKSDSLYNYGMRPLVYSEQDATEKQIGWVRTGHHITYTRNVTNTGSPLLQRCVPYYMLEWQMEFPNSDDTYYLAHCYPYTFTDLKDDLDVLMASPERKACVRREVLCESRAGNSCFLITVTNFENTGPKKAVVVSARVHPGESQASWMMKGLLEFVTGPDPVAQELRDRFIFKMVPMLNPDGVIVGNYRCSLAARDLNRNYRHPRRENFPTIYNVKAMVEELAQKHEIMLYCDLHGHSRKHNVFMYGNNTSSEEDTSGVGAARAFISERLFPWLMSSKCPDKFSFRSCKFAIRRCKESTGRVVMWRQMNIYNSFTLEATFSGTILNKENCRHFNILDLMDVGRSLAKVVLDYQHVQENKMQQTEAVLQLTKAITQQILETRGLIGPGSALPDFLTVDKNVIETEAEAVQENAEKWTGAMLTLLQQPPQPDLSAANPDDKGQGRQERAKRAGTASSGLSKEEASKLLDRASLCTMDGCLNILAALNVRDALQESDSSDSDSESEPEMKPPEPKTRKKKRKSRKQRDKEHHDKKQASSDKGQEKEARGKTYSALPALLCAEAPPSNSHGHAFSGTNLSDTSLLTSAQLAKKQAGSNSVLDRLNKDRRSSQFQSKYEGRHNGGVPCFTEERSMERAAKRLAEMKKKYEDDKQRELTLYCVDEHGMYQYPPHMYPNVLTQDDFNHRLHVALSEGTANLSRTLMGMNVKTGYTHADNLQDMHPTINGNNYMLAAHLNGHSSSANHNQPTPSAASPHNNHAHPLAENHRDHSRCSSSEDSESESEVIKTQSAVPMSSRRSPYHLDMLQLQRSPTLTSWPVKAGGSHSNGAFSAIIPPAPVTKRIVRYKTSQVQGQGQGQLPRSLQRHSPNAAPPMIASGIQPISRDLPRSSLGQTQPTLQERQPQFERPRIGRGPLIRGLRHPSIRQGYSYE